MPVSRFLTTGEQDLLQALLPLLDDDKNFHGAALHYLGQTLQKQSKGLINLVKVMRSSTKDLLISFFIQSAP